MVEGGLVGVFVCIGRLQESLLGLALIEQVLDDQPVEQAQCIFYILQQYSNLTSGEW